MDMTEQTELQAVKEIAENMNIKVGNTKDVAKIKAMIEEASKPEPVKAELTGRALKEQKRAELKAEKMRLIRVKITPMSPFERQLEGTQIAISNDLLGEVSRYIPFEREWHVEVCLLAHLRERTYRKRVEETSPTTGRKIYRNEFPSAYGIVELPDLTKAELDKLAADQRARNAID
jgi:hypothetical protein